MGRKKPDKGGRRGGGRRTSSPRDQRRSDTAPNRAGNGAEVQGPSRLLLTRLLRDGAVWDVYVSTTAQSGGSNLTQLEFESTVAAQGAPRKKLRCARPVQGSLLDALHSGTPVSRASLETELALALGDTGPDDAADATTAEPVESATDDGSAADAESAESAADADSTADAESAADEPLDNP